MSVRCPLAVLFSKSSFKKHTFIISINLLYNGVCSTNSKLKWTFQKCLFKFNIKRLWNVSAKIQRKVFSRSLILWFLFIKTIFLPPYYNFPRHNIPWLCSDQMSETELGAGESGHTSQHFSGGEPRPPPWSGLLSLKCQKFTSWLLSIKIITTNV